MSGQDLYIELRDRYAYLDQALKAYRRYGRTYGKAESDYREALTTEMLKKRDEGMPVTILSDVCRGLPLIAKLRLHRDIAKAEYKAAQEAIQVYKLQIRLLEAQIDREYRG